MRLWHGGYPGLRVGDMIEGGHERQMRDDCPICQARAKGKPLIDPLTAHPDMVYVTTHREYARYYASLYGRGDLYRVEPVGDMVPSEEDHFPTWRTPAVRVVAAYDRAVLLTWPQRRALFREWTAADAASLP